MSTERTLDGYLRPSFEWRTIAYSVVALLFLWTFAPWIGLSDKWLIVFSMIFLILVGSRLNSLIYIKKYQMSLNVIDAFHLKADEIPWTDKLQWIGKGFAYLDSDAQKVWDAKKENLKPFYELPSFVEKLRDNEIKVELRRGVNRGLKERIGAFIATISKRQEFTIAILNISIRNIYKPLPPVGGNPLYHATGFVRETDIFMPLDDRAGHTIMFGQSRVGKTVFLRSQISQDIARRNGVAGVFDPKGDLELLGIMWSEAKRLNREEDFYVFLLGEPEISARYNAISSFSRLTAIAGRIANQMETVRYLKTLRLTSWCMCRQLCWRWENSRISSQ